MTVDLGTIDFTVLILLLLAAVGIGVWFGRRSTAAESFLLGSRSFPWWANLGSIVATETSTATVLSIPGAGFGPVDMKWLQLAMGFVLGQRFGSATTFVRGVLFSLLFPANEVPDESYG